MSGGAGSAREKEISSIAKQLMTHLDSIFTGGTINKIGTKGDAL